MPKLKRQGEADNRGATDFIESLDRGIPLRGPLLQSLLQNCVDIPLQG